MHRVLIADTAEAFTDDVCKQLKDDFAIKACRDGHKLLEICYEFDPDILVLNLMLPGLDGITAIRTLRDAGNDVAVIALLRFAGDYVLSQLAALDVKYVLTKPCAASLAVSHIRQLSLLLMQPDVKPWCLENEVEWILLSLGFRMGKSKFWIVCQTVLYKYRHMNSTVMKEIYPYVARHRGSNVAQVEKAIRTAIAEAFAQGDREIWRMYFPYTQKCPTNEEFLFRIAGSLMQKARLKKPYVPELEKAE